MDSLVVVDCQYDFIEGTLACQKGREAVRYLVEFINTHKVNVFIPEIGIVLLIGRLK